MRNNLLTRWIFAILLIFSSVAVFAQTNDVPVLPVDPSAVDPLLLFNSLVAVLTPLMIAGVKFLGGKVLPKLPKAILPALAPFVGMLIAYLFKVVGFEDVTTGWGAALYGLAGVAVREFVDQIKKFGAKGNGIGE